MFTIGEGDTPLVKADRLAERIGCKALYLKFEGCNPTGSFKDRGMVMAVAKAVEKAAGPSSALPPAIPAPRQRLLRRTADWNASSSFPAAR